jgi:hypothetical protein
MMFVTVFAGILNLASGMIAHVNAGQDAPFLLRAGADPVELTSEGGPPLGTIEDFQYPVERHQLTPGDLLLLYTDGVTEAEARDDSFYTAARLELLLRSAPRLAPKRWSSLCVKISVDLPSEPSKPTISQCLPYAGRAPSLRQTSQRTVISTLRLRGSDTCGPVGTAGSRSPRPATEIELA